ncbi:MAG: CocE/NonD family hydrolase [Euryarchaeota archaeon]|nr:CocE/NonD family hydrolase [Euryarchaeota archaeon]
MKVARLNPLAALGVVGLMVLSGCINAHKEYREFEIDAQYVNPGVFQGIYAVPEDGSQVLKPGPLRASKPYLVHLRSERPHYPGPTDEYAQESYVQISLAYWRPMKLLQDGTFENITEKVPIVIDAGPYFEAGLHCDPDPNNCMFLVNNTIDYASQTTPFSLRNFLPNGYAVAQIAIRGTGTSGGCMELMGPNEVADLNQAINWLASQDWSNGNVALQGVSYDGSTPWMAAGTGNPHVKTIVPISGLPDIFDLMFHNGSAESRGRNMQQFVYWPYGFSPTFPGNAASGGRGVANGRQDYQNRQNLICPEAWEGAVNGPFAEYTGGRGDRPVVASYWRERDYRDDVLKNYKGSVFLVHGLQDWNVDPHSAIPFNLQLRQAGFKMKELYGQWEHARPDSMCSARAPAWAWLPCRFDYGEILFRWFEHELKGNETLPTGPSIQVQDNRGFWRNVDTWPPSEAEWTSFFPVDRFLKPAPGTATPVRLMPPTSASKGPTHYLEFKSEPFAADTHFSGLPQFHIEFQAEGPGGYLGAWMFDENETGKVLDRKFFADPIPKERPRSKAGYPQTIGHAQIDLRYHAGGDQQAELVPGKKYVAKMEFEPLDVFIPAGHRLTVWLFQYHFTAPADRIESRVPSPVTVYLGGPGTALKMPMIDPDPATIFPVPGSHLPKREHFDFFHVNKPSFSTVIAPGAETAAGCPEAPEWPSMFAWESTGTCGWG